MVHHLAFECLEEAFDTGVVPAVAFMAHAGDEALRIENLLVASRRILTATIRVVQKPGPWASGYQRHGEGLFGQIHGQPVAHRPTDHLARVEIEDHGKVEPALRGPHVGEVPGLHPIRRPDYELTIEGVLGHGQPVMRLGGGAPFFHSLGSNPFGADQPGDAMFADIVPLLEQGVSDAGTAVGLTGLSMDDPNGRK